MEKKLDKTYEWLFTFIVTCLLLLGADRVVEAYFGGPPPFASFFRFDMALTANDFERQLKSMEQEEGFRIAFIGDSIIRGAAVPEGSQTIPAYLQQWINSDPELRSLGLKVFNFGIAGGREADKYGVLKTLADRGGVDMVIMNVTYPFFSQEILRDPVLFASIYPGAFNPQEKEELGITQLEIKAAVPEGAPGEEEDQTSGPPGQEGQDTTAWFEGWMVDQVLPHWQLYKYRQEVNRYLFGGHPVLALKEQLEKALGKQLTAKEEVVEGREEEASLPAKDRAENLYKPWYAFEWGQPEIDHYRRVFRVEDLDMNNLGYKYLDKTLGLMEERGIPGMVFLSPINFTLLERCQVIPMEGWEKSQARLKALLTARGVPWYDLQEAIPDHYFHDSLHMLEEGNKALAKILYQNLKTQLPAGLQRKPIE